MKTKSSESFIRREQKPYIAGAVGGTLLILALWGGSAVALRPTQRNLDATAYAKTPTATATMSITQQALLDNRKDAVDAYYARATEEAAWARKYREVGQPTLAAIEAMRGDAAAESANQILANMNNNSASQAFASSAALGQGFIDELLRNKDKFEKDTLERILADTIEETDIDSQNATAFADRGATATSTPTK
jgi:hypothetical protein